jgi:hypothetical protein
MKMPPTTALSGKDKADFNAYKETILAELEKPAKQPDTQDESETNEISEWKFEDQPSHQI